MSRSIRKGENCLKFRYILKPSQLKLEFKIIPNFVKQTFDMQIK